MNGACQLGGRFSKCKAAAVETCQYCGKSACQQHLYYREGHEAVCTRKPCRAKHDDIQLHLQYKADVAKLNQSGLCGVPDCSPHPAFECSLCRGKFCSNHIRSRMYPFNNGYTVIDRPASVCDHCWARRKLWRKR